MIETYQLDGTNEPNIVKSILDKLNGARDIVNPATIELQKPEVKLSGHTISFETTKGQFVVITFGYGQTLCQVWENEPAFRKYPEGYTRPARQYKHDGTDYPSAVAACLELLR